ncbi:hypothetical protein MPSEU_000846500 [Mayamaea pseudoterrestris]|nr:hypothetical protein MPSEU_000846500 [Mayamaea pseudoterrestris]
MMSMVAVTAVLVAVAIGMLRQGQGSSESASTTDMANRQSYATEAPSPSSTTSVPSLRSAPYKANVDKDPLPANDDDAIMTTEAPHAQSTQDPSARAPCKFTSSTPPPPPFPGKKGIGMRLDGQVMLENLRKVVQLHPYWNCSWDLQRVKGQPNDIEFVPMIWGNARTQSELASELQMIVDSGTAKRILAFNEPDRKKQANMPVWKAMQTWPTISSTNLPIIGPSCSQPTGKWMQKFYDKVKTKCLRIDYVGIHWYGNANAAQFKQHMADIYAIYQQPLVITEFAPADWSATTVQNNQFSAADVLNFAKEVMPWLEETEWVAAYAWFPFNIDDGVGTSSALFDNAGDMTVLGRFYASVSTEYPSGDQWIQSD